MNSYLKRLLLGLVVWGIPFVTSFFVWDPATNGPSIDLAWFNALMAFTWAVGFAIAAFVYFKDSKGGKYDGWVTGVLWYVEMLVLDLVVLVGLFGMSFAEYSQFFLVYLNTVVISGAIGMLKK